MQTVSYTAAGVAQTLSAGFKAQVSKGYVMSSLVEVWSPGGAKLADSSQFQVIEGSITVDATADWQRRLENLRLVDASGSYVPLTREDVFSVVSNNEIRVYTGLLVGGTVVERIAQGIFDIAQANVEDTADGQTITVSGYDRARKISRNRTIVPQIVAASSPPTTTAITAAQALITQGRPGTLMYIVGGVDPQLGTPEIKLPENTDLWRAALDILAGIGWTAYFDVTGAVAMRPIPDPNSTTLTSAWTYAEGVDATLLGLARGFDNDPVFNGQIVTGSNTSQGYPARAEVWDTDVNSPTYYLGPYGKVPEFVDMQTINTDAAALAAAQGRLNQRKGVQEALQFSVVPNPAHEAWDPVTVTRSRSKVSGQYLVDKFTLGLGASAGAMQITCRPRRI